jgi:SAM-dependent methyltransferase
MVQELVARLRFAAAQLPFPTKSVLDYGCGTGAGLQWLSLHSTPRRALGLDVSPGAIAFAQSHYPGIEYRVADIEAPPQDLRREFDLALCLEVLEHLQDPGRALHFLAHHYLKTDGVLVSSTPNRMVFSAGTEPSPINRTHLHEMDLAEFLELLRRHFADTRIWGMRFRAPGRRRAHARAVQQACDGLRLLGDWWWNPMINRFYRWIARAEIWRLARREQYYRWKASDFEFIDDPDEIAETSIWFLAASSGPIKETAIP